MPFTPQTLDFLMENQLHDSRTWYHEHKDDYKRYVIQPFVEFIDRLVPDFEIIDSRIQCGPKHISRLFRDARRCRGKSIFRDSVWCTFRTGIDNDYSKPSFYFEFSPSGFDMGCGYYMMSADSRDALRQLILDGDPLFTEALNAYEQQDFFSLYGDMYKRNQFPEQEERVCDWLNRKRIGMTGSSADFDLFFSDGLADFAGEKFRSLAAFWKLLDRAEENVRSQKM